MALRSSALGDRLSRLESRIAQPALWPMTKGQRDALVRHFLAGGNFPALLASEAEDHRRAVIEAAMRADR